MIRAALVLCLATGAQAATVGEEDAMTINPLGGADFEVVSGSYSGVAEYYWCGAATYVIRRTGRSPLTPVYLKRPPGPSVTVPGRKGVVFSTSDEGLPPARERLTLTMETPGAMLKAVAARSYCRDAFTRSTK